MSSTESPRESYKHDSHSKKSRRDDYDKDDRYSRKHARHHEERDRRSKDRKAAVKDSVEKEEQTSAPEKEKYPVPNWAASPPDSYYLEVVKDGEIAKKVYFESRVTSYFGRNPKQADVVIEHASSSRLHALILYHAVLKRFVLVDLGSSHGSFYGSTKLESLTPTFLDLDAPFHFGASSRRFIIRRSQLPSATHDDDEDIVNEKLDNRRIADIPISAVDARRKKRPRGNVAFLSNEEIINPEDVDPTVGRFRNLVTTAVITKTGLKRQQTHDTNDAAKATKIFRPCRSAFLDTASPASSLKITLNAAPDVEHAAGQNYISPEEPIYDSGDALPSKKKYAKEAWPGRKLQDSKSL